MIVNQRKSCAVCNCGDLQNLMDLPRFPITGQFSREMPLISSSAAIDQVFLWCPSCGHGQLLNQVDPDLLYGGGKYSFRTAGSATARQGAGFFIDFLKGFMPGEAFNCILEVGCNDLYLLDELRPLGRTRIGLDPLWATKDRDSEHPDIMVIGGTVEETDLERVLPCRPDLIVCRHTLEHIYDPQLVIEKLIASGGDDTLFVFEVPGFEALLSRGRFDYVFHEHLQYFSLGSFKALIERCGGEMVGYTSNYHYWGALVVAFRKGRNKGEDISFPYKSSDIMRKRDLFLGQIRSAADLLAEFGQDPACRIYGYGAGLMLPVLAYHLESDLSMLETVIDDDEEKDGLYYVNLPLSISHPGRIGALSDATVMVCSLDNIKPIMIKLLDLRPRHIISPLNIM